MSYLLEALQKSQKDRDQQLPNLQTPALQIEVPDEAPRSPWIYIAIAALAINSIVIVYLLFKPSTTITTTTATPAAVITTAPRAAIATTSAVPNQTTVSVKDRISVQEIDDNPDNNSQAFTPDIVTSLPMIKTVDTEPKIDPRAVSEIYQLPFDLRSQIPALEMNSHIYAPNQADSFVMINNTSLTPGDQLTPELKLLAVTPDGAVLQFGETKFLLPALKSFKP